MRITIAAVGKIKERYVREAIDDYASRVRRYATFEERELDDLADASLADAITKAAKQATVVPLDSRGEELDSRGFASLIEKLSRTGKGDVTFAIGGKDGLGPKSLALGPRVLSLSKMTWPHRLARLMLVEQIYRAFTILNNEPYAGL
ncbi:MAG: 23S rRNA (pseudouridine(1915)-N(3))-methyltransferase RlmH [Polyangiaceae bacterium]|nr:23S rRNA (pseudouridine(1915)-N(3))-methyltransferase RlmH [Polyangiaceae bacterium]